MCELADRKARVCSGCGGLYYWKKCVLVGGFFVGVR